MKIRQLIIENFRGIKKLNWSLSDSNIFCLIGRGDSTKSTILEALRRVFHPQWYLSFDDADFYHCDLTDPIKVEVVLGNLPCAFCDLEKYGHWLCGWDTKNLERTTDPGEGREKALIIRLSVNKDLEPSWSVIKNDNDKSEPFKVADRAKVAVSMIGAISDRNLTWSRGSILSQLTETENIADSLAEVARAAKIALDSQRTQALSNFDKVARKAQDTACRLGVNVIESYKAHLDTDAINVRISGLTLHSGNMPLRLLGLGSKRMLTTGLQQHALQTSHITLFDEVEVGLEPHRIARLLKHLKEDRKGQYFLTTHSPVVLRELDVSDLHIVQCDRGDINVVAAYQPDIADDVQGKIRTSAEAFLAPKIIVCEGATEVGFLRGLDDCRVKKGKKSFAYCGVALLDAGGDSKIKKNAEILKLLGYDIAVLADSDNPKMFSDEDAEELRSDHITVAKWGDELSIEERVFKDLSWAGVKASFDTAYTLKDNDKSLYDQVNTHFEQNLSCDSKEWTDTPELRTALGKAAKSSNWFKSQSSGHKWAVEIFDYLEDKAIKESDLVVQMKELQDWIDNE